MDNRERLRELIVLKEKINLALAKGRIEEAKQYYNKINVLYMELTGESFEKGLSDAEKESFGILLSLDKKRINNN